MLFEILSIFLCVCDKFDLPPHSLIALIKRKCVEYSFDLKQDFMLSGV